MLQFFFFLLVFLCFFYIMISENGLLGNTWLRYICRHTEVYFYMTCTKTSEQGHEHIEFLRNRCPGPHFFYVFFAKADLGEKSPAAGASYCSGSAFLSSLSQSSHFKKNDIPIHAFTILCFISPELLELQIKD